MMPIDGGCVSEGQTRVFILLLPNDFVSQSHPLIKCDSIGADVAIDSVAQAEEFGRLGPY